MRVGGCTGGRTHSLGPSGGPSVRRYVISLAFSGFVGAALVGCPSSTTSLPYTPYTGINFVSQDILEGFGCGTAGDQVLKYAVVLGDPSDASVPALSPLPDGAQPAYASLFDCSTNGVFSSILTSSDGGPTIEAWIYAYNAADFQALQSEDLVPGFASCALPTCPLSLSDVQLIVRTYSAYTTYTTTCTAVPESGDNVLASCLPLTPRPGGSFGTPADSSTGTAAASDSMASENDASEN